MRKIFIACLVAPLMISCTCDKSKPVKTTGKELIYGPETAVAVSPTGQEIAYDYPALREGKKVGIFYFVLIGAHGYDIGGGTGEIVPPKASDFKSPYDISELEKGKTDISQIEFGPTGAMHYWGKPYLDYYVGNDEWVIRKHAQWLATAGVDIIFIDLTNGYPYVKTLQTLFDIYLDLISTGAKVPQISFVLNANPEKVLPSLVEFYTNKKYSSLWYYFEGKPFLLAPKDCRARYKNLLSFRYCWFDTHGKAGNWWDDSGDCWTWGDLSPQTEVQEEMSVLAGSHANWNIGRSFTGDNYGAGFQPETSTEEMRAKGIFFHNQFDRVLQCDPDLVFITGWNEWVAQRQIANVKMPFLGRTIDVGDLYFVDCYNHEFSRDIEPCANDFKDIYYYYMADYIRRYKGIKPVSAVKEKTNIKIDGKFDDWLSVPAKYVDYIGDTTPRNHFGFGFKNIKLENNTGRNDIKCCKIATDGESAYFYVETVSKLTPHTDNDWMKLFIEVLDSQAPAWEGFQFVVNRESPRNSNFAQLERSNGGWSWEKIDDVPYSYKDNKLELAIPLLSLDIESARTFTIDFKWVDNAISDGDICTAMSDGDSAPDNRWRYRFIYKEK